MKEELFPDNIVTEYSEGRDELNLAEFPIAAISHRSDPGIKTLKFADRTFDKASQEIIERRLVITACDEYGLPAAADDEVLLGLLQISRLQKFESSTVRFTFARLLKILGWPPSTHNYHRIRDAINRWLGVTLYYDNAWRDRETGQWVDAKFHFIEFAELQRPGREYLREEDCASVIKWNDLVFRNFREGNLKTLDFHLYRSLESGIAKRLFRFLDKRFYHRPDLVFALEAFACDKIGLTRPLKISNRSRTATVDVAQLKRRLLPAILELEQHKFIIPRTPEKRFTKDSAGVWQVHFERFASQSPMTVPVGDVGLLEGRLIGHGVGPAHAHRLVSEYADGRIEAQLDALEFLLTGKTGAPESRSGWLVAAITENYTPPRGFKLPGDGKKPKSPRASPKSIQLELEPVQDDGHQREADQVADYLASLPEQQRLTVEQDALDSSPLTRGRMASGNAGALLRRSIIHEHVLKLLKGPSGVA
ncbi:MAG: hypothetical protein EOP86_12590 [Verrucomicrobiaceae bacterium]|nr:MAG: hypothetical protein EOP86_12590 [Verrucomicrobiaceae bacterium]